MTETDAKILHKSLVRIKNVSYIMEILFQKINDNDNHNVREQKIERIEKAYQYLKKYGPLTLKEAIKDVKDVTDKILIETNRN